MAAAFSSELTCPICLELFYDPVTLPCMHSYCRKCLESILHSSGGKEVQCPECRSTAYMQQGDLDKLPRNFFIANIVEKYQNVDNIPKIPCDICEETKPQSAVKSCKECKISYCGQCLFLHPKKGVLATHSLIEPKDFVQTGHDKFCLKCLIPPKEGADLDSCTTDHPTEVVGRQVAKMKLLSKMQESYAVLNDRKRRHIQDTHATEEALFELQTKAAERRAAMKLEVLRKYEPFSAEFEANVQQAEEKGQQHLLQLRLVCSNLSDLLPSMDTIVGADENEIDLMDLLKIFNRVSEEVGKGTKLGCDISLPYFDIGKEMAELDGPSTAVLSGSPNNASECSQTSEKNEAKLPTEKVMITSKSSCVRKKEEGASISVGWYWKEHETDFELKFVEATKKDTKMTITVSNIKGLVYTETHLKHDTVYDVTVSVQGNPLSESKCIRVSTPHGVSCEEFTFDSEKKSGDVELQLNQKLVIKQQKCDDTSSFKRITGAAGTLILLDVPCYWEVLITFHLRGIKKNCYAAAFGLCITEKMDAISVLGNNYYFYGIKYGKGINGSPVVTYMEEGDEELTNNMRGEHKYYKNIGFFFKSSTSQLVIIDVRDNVILFKTKQLRTIRGTSCAYCPVCDFDLDSDATFELVTGSSIKQIPSCLREELH